MIKPKLALYYVAIAALLSVAAFSSLRLLNLDSINYIAIAQHYADGHWKEAVNGHWSPLLSWLLLPFVKSGVDPQAASRIVMVGIGLATLALGDRLVRLHAAGKGKKAALVIYHLAMVPFLVTAVHGLVSPDLLVVLFVLLILTALSRTVRLKDRSKRTLIVIGVLGGVGFLAKAFLLPFFVVTAGVWYLMLGEGGLIVNFSERLKRFGLVLAAFAITILPWVTALSLKYDQVSLGTVGKYSLAYIGPESVGHPARNGLLPPPHDYANSPMEDPSSHPYVEWSPFESQEDLAYFTDYLFNRNIPTVNAILAELSPYLLGILLILAGLLVTRQINLRQRNFLTLAAIMSVIYILGYYASHVVGGGRYLWPVLVLSFLVASTLGGAWYVRANGRLQKTFAILLIAIFVWPSYFNFYAYRQERGYEEELSLYRAGQFVKDRLEPRTRFASNNLRASTRISYYADLKGYGTTAPRVPLSDPGTLQALRDYGVEYFFYVDHPLVDNDKEDLSGFEVIGTTHVNFADHRSKFPGGPHKAYLIKLN